MKHLSKDFYKAPWQTIHTYFNQMRAKETRIIEINYDHNHPGEWTQASARFHIPTGLRSLQDGVKKCSASINPIYLLMHYMQRENGSEPLGYLYRFTCLWCYFAVFYPSCRSFNGLKQGLHLQIIFNSQVEISSNWSGASSVYAHVHQHLLTSTLSVLFKVYFS